MRTFLIKINYIFHIVRFNEYLMTKYWVTKLLLEKYTNQHIPYKSTLKKNYVNQCFTKYYGRRFR